MFRLQLLPFQFVFLILFSVLFQTSVYAETLPPVGQSVPKPGDYFLEILVSLFLVLAIIFLAAWLLRRYGRFPGVADGNLKVLGALSVGQREKILLLQVGDEQLLVGVTSSRISTLHQLTNPIEIKDPQSLKDSLNGMGHKMSFAQNLQNAIKGMPMNASKQAEVSKTDFSQADSVKTMEREK